MLSHPVIVIMLSGAAGALCRYGLVRIITPVLQPGQFPVGTWIVNILGSFLFGFLFVWISQRVSLQETLRLSLLVGFLGAFTTFSSFSFESLRLLQSGFVLTALIYILSSVALCLLATWFGMRLAEFIFSL